MICDFYHRVTPLNRAEMIGIYREVQVAGVRISELDRFPVSRAAPGRGKGVRIDRWAYPSFAGPSCELLLAWRI